MAAVAYPDPAAFGYDAHMKVLPIALLGLLPLVAPACGVVPPRADATAPADATLQRVPLGAWTYAPDPTGAIPLDPVYAGSGYTFLEDGTFRSQRPKLTVAGTWTLVRQTAEVASVQIAYAQGRTTEMHLQPVRDAQGRAVALIVWERDGASGRRYYLPAAPP